MKKDLAKYELVDTYNMNEMGLFYKMQPNKTLRDKEVSGMKKCKERLIVGLCNNIDSFVKLPPLVINRALMPRAFL